MALPTLVLLLAQLLSFAHAAGEAPAFFGEVTVLLVVSALIAYGCFRLGLVPIIGFLVAGVIIGPNALGLVQDAELIDAATELGVIFLLTVVAICLGTAYVTSLAGVSLSLGAFLAGLLVSESHFGQQALGGILPLQIIFSAAFFISVGLLLDLGFVVMNLPLVLAVILSVLALKALITTGDSLRLLGRALRRSSPICFIFTLTSAVRVRAEGAARRKRPQEANDLSTRFPHNARSRLGIP